MAPFLVAVLILVEQVPSMKGGGGDQRLSKHASEFSLGIDLDPVPGGLVVKSVHPLDPYSPFSLSALPPRPLIPFAPLLTRLFHGRHACTDDLSPLVSIREIRLPPSSFPALSIPLPRSLLLSHHTPFPFHPFFSMAVFSSVAVKLLVLTVIVCFASGGAVASSGRIVEGDILVSHPIYPAHVMHGATTTSEQNDWGKRSAWYQQPLQTHPP